MRVISWAALGRMGSCMTEAPTILDVPGSTHTEARAINDAGDVVGSFSEQRKNPQTGENENFTHGFLWTGDRYLPLDVAGSMDTQAYGINDRGQIVGAFINAEGLRHGFVATEVPEPGTLILLSTASSVG